MWGINGFFFKLYKAQMFWEGLYVIVPSILTGGPQKKSLKEKKIFGLVDLLFILLPLFYVFGIYTSLVLLIYGHCSLGLGGLVCNNNTATKHL